MIEYNKSVIGAYFTWQDIQAVEFDPRPEWSNDPEIIVKIIAKYPLSPQFMKYVDIRYAEDRILYWASNGLLAYMFVQTQEHTGFGGTKIMVEMANGSTQMLHGPWSGSPVIPNALGFRPCMPAQIILVDESSEEKRLQGLPYIMVDQLQLWLEDRDVDFHIVQVGDSWIPHPKKGCTTELKKALYRCPICKPHPADNIVYNSLETVPKTSHKK